MKRGIIILISIIILIILGVGAWLVYKNYESDSGLTENQKRCVELGCPEGSIYVGSINSDKYYVCECPYANQIKPENVVCFKTDEEALADNRIRSGC